MSENDPNRLVSEDKEKLKILNKVVVQTLTNTDNENHKT